MQEWINKQGEIEGCYKFYNLPHQYREPVTNTTLMGILKHSQDTKNNPFPQLFSWVWQSVLAKVHLVTVEGKLLPD